MNKELGYALRGAGLVAVLLISIRLFSFSFNTKEEYTYSIEDHVEHSLPLEEMKEQISNRLKYGRQLFEKRCNACHYITKGIIKMEGVTQRIDKATLHAFVRNSQWVIASGDPYFTSLYKEFNKVLMPSFPDLSNSDIDAIFNYIDYHRLLEK